MTRGNFHIDADKLQAVIDIYTDESEPRASTEDIESYILNDWPNADEHQEWLDTASAREIAEWIAAGVFED